MASQLLDFSNEIAAIVERVGPSVVAVNGNRRTPSSGVHWKIGLIVTVEHALKRDDDITLATSKGEVVQASIVGRDPGTDIALLRAEKLTIPVVDVGDSPRPRIGDLSLVVGRSPHSGPNATVGIVSAVSGPWRTWRGGQLDLYMRLGAEVVSGSSGGAVVNHRGQLIGIATSVLSRVAGLAIPTSTVNRIVNLLLEKGAVPRPYLGVGLQAVAIPESFREKLALESQSGLMVLSVEGGSSADQAGILVGDILLNISGKNLEEVGNLESYLSLEKIGKRSEANIIRGGELKQLSILVGERKTEKRR